MVPIYQITSQINLHFHFHPYSVDVMVGFIDAFNDMYDRKIFMQHFKVQYFSIGKRISCMDTRNFIVQLPDKWKKIKQIDMVKNDSKLQIFSGKEIPEKAIMLQLTGCKLEAREKANVFLSCANSSFLLLTRNIKLHLEMPHLANSILLYIPKWWLPSYITAIFWHSWAVCDLTPYAAFAVGCTFAGQACGSVCVS